MHAQSRAETIPTDSHYTLALFPGHFQSARNGLGTTVDACTFIPIKTWDIVYACILSISYRCNRPFHVCLFILYSRRLQLAGAADREDD